MNAKLSVELTLLVFFLGSATTQSSEERTGPVLNNPSLSVESDVALADGSNVFKDGAPFLWDNSGSGNTGVGRFALSSITTGGGNTAVGWNALKYGTDGTDNTGVGYFSLIINDGGYENTGVGAWTLYYNTTGASNTAVGNRALFYNDGYPYAPYYDGSSNAAIGSRALFNNRTGSCNTAVGSFALFENTLADNNTAVGCSAMVDHAGASNTAVGADALIAGVTGTSADNVAVGFSALKSMTAGSFNIGVGSGTGSLLETGSHNILIGNHGQASDTNLIRIGTAYDDADSSGQNKTYVAGIHNAPLSGLNEHPVCVDDADQLGVCSESSARFKSQIAEMGSLSASLLDLRPVVFHYKPEAKKGPRPMEYGLIAEEVAEVFPHLVRYDDEGQPLTLRYDLLTPLLLNELQKQNQRVGVLTWLVGLMLVGGVALTVGRWRFG